MGNISTGGIYHNVEARITSVKYNSPVPNEVFKQIKDLIPEESGQTITMQYKNE